METITKYKTKDGREFTNKIDAQKHEEFVEKIEHIKIRYLGGEQHELVKDNKGYYQHDPRKVKLAWGGSSRTGAATFCEF